MGMPVSVEVRDGTAEAGQLVFDYFNYVDQTFSTYKPDSEISKINRGELAEQQYSREMQEIFRLAEQTRRQTRGFFNIRTPGGTLDPSGLVKGWAIWQAGLLLRRHGYKNFMIDAGGDIQASVANASGQSWSVGIRNPFQTEQIVKVLRITDQGVATSGSYERGQHIYNPHQPGKQVGDILSLTVVGPNIYEADRFATAAFAMGREGVAFIELLDGLEGYIIDRQGIGTETSGFYKYVAVPN